MLADPENATQGIEGFTSDVHMTSGNMPYDGLAFDPLFENLDPFGISYWDGLGSLVPDASGSGFATMGFDSLPDNMQGVL